MPVPKWVTLSSTAPAPVVRASAKAAAKPNFIRTISSVARVGGVRRALSPVQGIDVISPQVRPTTRLKSILARRSATLMPGAANALFARIVEDLGFEACYVTGAGIANMHLGAPDIGLTTLTEVANHVAAMTDAVALPLLVDADTGFGNALSVVRTVKVLERAGDRKSTRLNSSHTVISYAVF